MFDILGDAYFRKPPPPFGVELRVAGSDGIDTAWRIDGSIAALVKGKVTNDPRVRLTGWAAYDQKPRAA